MTENDIFTEGVSAPLNHTLEVDITSSSRVGIDGTTIAEASVQPSGDLILWMSDGKTINAGQVAGRTFTGKRIVLYGDSITAEYGVPPETYTERIREKLGTGDVIRYGHSAQTLGSSTNDKSDTLTNDQQIGAVVDASPDVLILQGGLADYWHGEIPLGEYYGDIENNAYVKTSTGGLRYLLHHLTKNLPENSRILFVTPPPGTYNGVNDTTENMAGVRMDAYVKRFREICAEYHVPVCDVWGMAGWSAFNENLGKNYTTDGVHLSPKGYDRMTDLIATEAARYL